MKRIFISIQWILNSQQRSLFNAVQAHLKQLGLSPIMIEQNTSNPLDDPFLKIRQTLLDCHGAIVIAFERLHFFSGVEYLGDDLITFNDRRSSTLWNHIEASMACQAGLPVLILQENGLHQEGIIYMQLTSLKVLQFRLDECIDELPQVIKEALNEWFQFI